ncbi:glycerate kinase [Corynebacterium sp. TAE3-ERU12]|uniref:glycerate kinase family protein n=1 Tax=Corynebacterium sp. TAE3-ERU12 TaxID=2849491 RepID=UPI001C45F74B|nr:glycerate kinase [Corynebacterium sp. TAE3-ERU12]MBV7296156.1 glycerate kinase [Corynebacterium sp. TAE3-ERU12]
MRAVICPDSFKSTATAPQVAAALARGLNRAGIDTVNIPMADGGEGTAELLAGYCSTNHPARRYQVATVDAHFRPLQATYYLAETTAFIDIAAASGLPHVEDLGLSPQRGLAASTYGTGVLIADAVRHGATTIALCLGGSATTDGGTGIVEALTKATREGLDISALHFDLYADVRTPPCGPNGAAAVFGPQKGLDEHAIGLADHRLAELCEKVGVDPHDDDYGAAGATPVGIAALAGHTRGFTRHSGAHAVATAAGLADAIGAADVVITGEGHVDQQSLIGKVIGLVHSIASARTTPVVLVGGRVAPTIAESLKVLASRELGGKPNPDTTEEQLVSLGEQLGRELPYLVDGG